MTSLDIIHDDLLLELVLDLLESGRDASFIALGSSMHPVIRSGEKVTVTPAAAADLRPGMVALYLAGLPDGGRGMVIHRYLGVDPDGSLIMRGDACPLPDPPVNPSLAVGRVIQVQRGETTITVDSITGGMLLNGNSGTGRLLARLSKLRSYLAHPVSFLPVTHGRLLRERSLLSISIGDIHTISTQEESGERIRLSGSENELLPLVVYQARHHDIDITDILPPNAEQLEVEALTRSAHTESALNWTGKILAEAGEEIIVTKGAAMAFNTYPSPQCRPAADIDCLVREDRVKTVVDALLKAGASLAEPEEPLSYYLRFKNEVPLRLPRIRWPVLELHWRGSSTPFYNRRSDAERYWQETKPFIFGKAIRVLSPEAEFVHEIAHLAKHYPYFRLLWAVDLAMLSRQIDNWEKVTEWIDTSQLWLPAAIVTRWIDDHIPGILPEGLSMAMGDAAAHTGRFERAILYHENQFLRRIAEALSQPCLKTRLSFMRQLVFPGRRVMERLFPEHRHNTLPLLHAKRISQILARLFCP